MVGWSVVPEKNSQNTQATEAAEFWHAHLSEVFENKYDKNIVKQKSYLSLTDKGS